MKKGIILLFLMFIFLIPLSIVAEDRHHVGFWFRLRPGPASEYHPRVSEDFKSTYYLGLFYEYQLVKYLSLQFQGSKNSFQYNSSYTDWEPEYNSFTDGDGSVWAFTLNGIFKYEILKNLFCFASLGLGLQVVTVEQTDRFPNRPESELTDTYKRIYKKEWNKTHLYTTLEAGIKIRMVKQLELLVSIKQDNLATDLYKIENHIFINFGINIYFL